MKERGILFLDWGVRAILAGLKTQTRRVVKPQPDRGFHRLTWWRNPDDASQWFEVDEDTKTRGAFVRCPYGQPGDLLWVKCAWREMGSVQGQDGRQPPAEMLNRHNVVYRFEHPEEGPWRSPWFMPRHVSPIDLPMTALRVERVQDISEADAVAEGISEPEPSHGKWCDPTTGRESHWSYRRPFARIWDSIHGPGAWERNDWVWVPQWEPVTQ